ncbi:MAG: hypothetical protein GXO50_01385 [Chlorobi bacterium]|nr:hypothetical protein [Chlorobiota bacterium]
MEKLKVWSKKLNDKIEQKKEDIYKRDYAFFKIDRLERINERIDVFSDNCKTCENFKPELEHIVDKLPEYINGSPRMRAEYEKRSDKVVKHLKKEHGLVSEQYYSSLYSFIGIISGTALFAAISVLIQPGFLKWGALAGFTVGLIAGKIFGHKKDKEKKINDLIL